MSTVKPTKPPKGCYQCMKRRVVCDRTEPECAKCLKKGITCTGMGIRYRFNDGIAARGKLRGQTYQAPVTQIAAPSTAIVRSPKKLRWVQQRINASDSARRVFEDADVRPSEEHAPELIPSEEHLISSDEAEQVALEEVSEDATSPTAILRGPQIIDAKTRYLFAHFSDYVSPTMTFIDGAGNGYRHHILPQGVLDPMVQRAVCVASAFHLSVRQPELRLPAEAGRAAIITKLRQKATHGSVFNLTTYSTLVLLFVGELITGSDDITALYRMLLSFVKTHRGSTISKLPLERFLEEQTKLFAFFTEPALSEDEGMARFIQEPEPDITEVQDMPHAISFHYRASYRQASALYLLRAQSDCLHLNEMLAADMVAQLYNLLVAVDQTAPGAHALVWPYFVAAAESTLSEHKMFFFQRLEYIWETTRYRNVKVALSVLNKIWEMRGTTNEIRWTRVIPDIGVPIM